MIVKVYNNMPGFSGITGGFVFNIYCYNLPIAIILEVVICFINND